MHVLAEVNLIVYYVPMYNNVITITGLMHLNNDYFYFHPCGERAYSKFSSDAGLRSIVSMWDLDLWVECPPWERGELRKGT